MGDIYVTKRLIGIRTVRVLFCPMLIYSEKMFHSIERSMVLTIMTAKITPPIMLKAIKE